MTRRRDHRGNDKQDHEQTPVPIVLPHVVVEVAENGTMTVTVDGTVYEPEPFAPPWRRESFAHVLDRLTERHHCPLRVEVHEADGTTFTDIITPGKRRLSPPEPTAAQREIPELLVRRGEGFAPGEDVAIAIVVAHGDAAPDGAMRAVLTADQLAASPTREVILFGRVSGTLTIGRPE